MKIYIYKLNSSYSGGIKSLTEHICETRETEKKLIPAGLRCFPEIYLTRIDKEPMPRFHDGSIYLSTEPLEDDQIRNLFIDVRKQNIKALESKIERVNKEIDQLSAMEVERNDSL